MTQRYSVARCDSTQVAWCDSVTLRLEIAAVGAICTWGCLDDPAVDSYLANQSAVQVTVPALQYSVLDLSRMFGLACLIIYIYVYI